MRTRRITRILALPRITAKDIEEETFGDHLSALRRGLSIWLFFFLMIACLFFWKNQLLIRLITRPLNEPLIYTSPTGGIFFICQIAVFVSLIVTIPILVYQIFKFVKPALDKDVIISIPKFFLFSYSLLVISILFTYFLIVPTAIQFLKSFDNNSIRSLFSTNDYLSFVLTYLIGMAFLFQLPVIVLVTNHFIPLETKFLMKFQRIVIVLSFVVAAIITPTPDPINQTIMALPVIILYEISILLVYFKNKKITLQFKKTRLFVFVLILLLLCLLAIDSCRELKCVSNGVNVFRTLQNE